MLIFNKEKNIPNPFIKWVGGKTQLLPILIQNLPTSFNRYIEPFLGGGALYFDLKKDKPDLSSIILDYNEELITTYQIIRDYPHALIQSLKSIEYSKDSFLHLRGYSPKTSLEIASRFIFLNKTGFNGLYRVNSKGKFNVPFGTFNLKKSIFKEENILKVSEVLNNQTEIIHSSIFYISQKIQFQNNFQDFVYLDPPYQPITKTSNFTSYTKERFLEKQQIELKELFDILTENKILAMLSNSHCGFILNLYKNYNIIEVDAKRNVNSDGEKRGKIKEVLIKNY